MIIPVASAVSRYADGDPYAAADQYGSSGMNGSRYGDQYGTGTYSDYSTSRGRYSTSVEINRYSSGSGYNSSMDSAGGYGSLSTDSYRYGDGQETMTGVGSLDYVIDVLDGDVEFEYSDAALYRSVYP